MKKPKAGRPKGSVATLTRPVHIKFSEDQYKEFKAAADADRRPFVHWVRLACERLAEEQKANGRPNQ